MLAPRAPMTPPIDFDAINRAALERARLLLQQIIPGGKFRSLEYVARNPRRNDHREGSFKINYKTGQWADFATGDKGGDLVSLLAYIRDMSQSEAARELARLLGRNVPAANTSHTATKSNQAPNGRAAESDTNQAPFLRWGEEGPPARQNEVRRHRYRYERTTVRIKIKFTNGEWVNWYRIIGNDGASRWQAKKPNNYKVVPYVSEAIDPFDPELKDDQIFWPEGEKDVDTLNKLNLPAFTFGGTGDGLPSGIDQYLIGRHLVIPADNDGSGRDHAEKKAARAHEAGAASIRILHFPELPLKDDVTDFIAKGGTAEELIARIDAAALWSPQTVPERGASVTLQASPVGWRAKIVMANDLQAMTFPPVRHILPGYIPEGATIIAGKPKIGKSLLALDLCLAATADRFTLGTLKPAQGDVLYLALEDNNRRLKRRMGRLWPNTEARWPDRLALVTEWKRADEGGLDDIEEWCRWVADPVMVVIDTLEKFRPLQNGKMNAYSADYSAVTGLQKIAGTHRIAVVINHHVRKMEAEDPFDTISGTFGLTGAADTIIVLKRHAGAVTLHARGRDIEEVETALQFERTTCRWTILGAASEVYVSKERAAVLCALAGAGAEGLAVPEIMAACGSNNRGATDTLLFKMKEGSEIVRVKRGVYALAQDAGKIGQKERNGNQTTENIGLNGNLCDLTDLTGAMELELVS